jgi:hypothetical protein
VKRRGIKSHLLINKQGKRRGKVIKKEGKGKKKATDVDRRRSLKKRMKMRKMREKYISVNKFGFNS